MTSVLDQLRTMTTVVADTGNAVVSDQFELVSKRLSWWLYAAKVERQSASA